MDVPLFLAMSIAVTVVVRPSRFLNALVRGMCLCVALVGIAIGLAWVGDLSFLCRMSLAVACFLAAATCLHAERNRNTYQISISGDGQIRLSEYAVACDGTLRSAGNDAPGEVLLVSLLDYSFIWPLLLLLHLKADNKRIFIIPILSDSLSAPGFRSLSVACRWIAAHNKSINEIS